MHEKTMTAAVVWAFGEEETVFRRLLSSIGGGGAKVDTRLSAESYVPGGPVSGGVYITGGEDAQEFNRIYWPSSPTTSTRTRPTSTLWPNTTWWGSA